MGVAYKSLCQYELAEALKQFKALPAHHYNTPWVLTNTAHVLLAGEKFKEVSNMSVRINSVYSTVCRLLNCLKRYTKWTLTDKKVCSHVELSSVLTWTRVAYSINFIQVAHI